MKALVTYYSQTGNTEKLAQAIYEGIEPAEPENVAFHDSGFVRPRVLTFFQGKEKLKVRVGLFGITTD